MYKFYKLINNNWVETATIGANHGIYWRDSKVTKLADKLGYTRILSQTTKRLTNNYYFKSDCACFDSENVANSLYYYETQNLNGSKVYVSMSQQKFDSMSNTELLRIYGVTRCDDCGKIQLARYNITVGRNHVYCSDCVNNHATRCDNCGHWYMKRTSLTTYNVAERGEMHVCNRCKEDFERRLHTCADCGRVTLNARRIMGSWYCYDCATNHEIPNLIRDYHYQHGRGRGFKPQYAKNEKQCADTLLIGFEDETECQSDVSPNENAYAVHKLINTDENNRILFFEHDGSITHGYETISQPCSIAWYYENAEMIKQVFQTMRDGGCDSDNVNTCGLHLHLSRAFFKDYDYENRFCYLFARLKDKIVKFSRRTRFGYCQPLSHIPTWETIYDDKRSCMGGHGSAINVSNRNTIEIRIFKSTLNFDVFMACIEFTRNLATFVRDNTEITTIENATFETIVNYCDNEYLTTYCQQNRLIGGAN